MTASRTGLLVLSVVAAALAAIILLGGGRGTATVSSRRLVPDFTAASARRVTIERPGEAAIVIDVPAASGTADDGAASPPADGSTPPPADGRAPRPPADAPPAGAPADGAPPDGRAPRPPADAPPAAGPTLAAPVTGPVEPSALDDLLGAVGLLNGRRKAGAAEATRAPRATVTIERGDGEAALAIVVGPELPDVDGAWVAVRGVGRDADAYLVDASLARSLTPPLDALRPKRALRLGDVTGVEVHGPLDLLLSGRPLRMHLPGVGGAARARAERVEALRDALEAVRFTRFADGTDVATPRLVVRVVGEHPRQDLEVFGPCPGAAGQTLLRAPPGLGCADDAAIAAIEAALPPSGVPDAELLASWIEPRLIPPGVAVAAVAFAVAGRSVELRSDRGAAWRLGGGGGGKTRLDPAAPAAVVAALAIESAAPLAAGPAPPVTSLPKPTIAHPELAWLTIETTTATDTVIVDRARARARRGAEPVELVVAPEVLAILDEIAAVGEQAVADPTVILEQPTAAALVKMEDLGVDVPLAVVTRGDLVGEWHLVLPASRTVDAEAVAALVEAAAHLRAERRLPRPAGKLWRRITIVFDAAPIRTAAPDGDAGAGAPPQTSYVIDLGRPEDAGCEAQLVGAQAIAFTLAPATCAALTRPLVK